jgi:hypothetical protein
MQAIIEYLTHGMRHSVNIWLYDNIIHVTDKEKLLEVLENFFNSMQPSVTSTAPKSLLWTYLILLQLMFFTLESLVSFLQCAL